MTFNSSKVIKECLLPLQNRADLQLIVVDNASSDLTVQIVREIAPSALVILNQKNLGFAQAVNIGAEHAKGKVILLLNPDAVIEPTQICAALEKFNQDPKVGIIGPLTLEANGAFRTLAAGFRPSIGRMWLHASGLSRLGKFFPCLRGHYLLRDQVRDNSSVSVEWVSGGCMFIRTSLWRDLRGLTTRWFMYAEDIDICLRAADKGFQICLDSSISATHAVGGSSGESRGVNTLWIENLLDLYSTKIAPSRAHVWLWKIVVKSGFAMRLGVMNAFSLMNLGNRQQVEVNRERFRAYISGLTSKPKSNQFARYYPMARTAHIERLAEQKPADFLYTRTRGDWDADLAFNALNVKRVSLISLGICILKGDYLRIEMPELLALPLVPNFVFLSVLASVRNCFVSKNKVEIVFYAIENMDQVTKLRQETRLPEKVARSVIRMVARVSLIPVTKIAFGSNQALSQYKTSFGHRLWAKVESSIELEVFTPLEAASKSTQLENLPLSKDSNLVGFLGSFERRKGIPELMKAWPHVLSENPKAKLEIIGYGEMQREILEFSNDSESVYVGISPSRETIMEKLGKWHVLILFSQPTTKWREQIGLPILEGLSSGCEIVTSSETALSNWLAENRHQVLSPAADAQELANSILKAVESKRSATDILRSLPAISGRLQADAWMFS